MSHPSQFEFQAQDLVDCLEDLVDDGVCVPSCPTRVRLAINGERLQKSKMLTRLS
jgi:hypothetical protein